MEWSEDTEVLDLDPREIEADDDYKDYFASIRSFTPDSTEVVKPNETVPFQN